MKELTDLHADRFYIELINSAKLLEERVSGKNDEDEFRIFFGFEDALDEAEEEGFELEEYGEAYFFKDGKVYLVTVHLETNEAIGINELDQKETKSFVQELIENSSDGEDYFYQENEWAITYK